MVDRVVDEVAGEGLDGELGTVAAAARAGPLAALAIAGRFEGVTGAQWQRAGRRSDGARFTVETFARYFMHDPVHHLWDVTGRRAVIA